MGTKLWVVWRCASVSVHMVGVLIYGLGFIFLFIYPWDYNWEENDRFLDSLNTTAKPGVYTYGWRYKYLSFWNLNFQLFGFFLFLVCDCFKDNYLPEKAIESYFKKRLFRIRDVWFHSVIFPTGLYVCTAFWTLYFINKDLVTSPNMKTRNPMWLSHVQHTVLAPIIILEAILTYHRRSRIAIELTVMLTIFMSYLLWVLYLGYIHNVWVYGILSKSSTIGRALFIASCMIYSAFIYFIGILVHKYVWSPTRLHLFPKSWSPDVVSKEHEFEDFRVRQGLIRTCETDKDISLNL